jgi:hypothetical protein
MILDARNHLELHKTDPNLVAAKLFKRCGILALSINGGTGHCSVKLSLSTCP